MPSAVDIISRNESLEKQRGTWDSFWQNLANYIQIRKAEINTVISGPDTERADHLFDSTAQQSNMTLANGQMSLVSPVDDVWFEFKPPLRLKDDVDAISYYRQVSEVVRDLLAQSNFYTQMHEMYLQRSGFGTAVMFPSIYKGKLLFKSYDIGTYSICEDAEGMVDTFFRRYELSARQSIQKFGEDKVHPAVLQASKDPAKCDDQIVYIHAVFPREDMKPGGSEVERMPFASYHVDEKNKHIAKESGFRSFPFHVTRYLKWSDKSTDPYGWCPGWTALPDIRQVNFLSEMLDVLAEKAAFPPIKAPATMEGEIDLRAAGITFFDPIMDKGGPEEWVTQGRYDVGMDRLTQRQKAIEEAYHVDLFKLFSKLDRGAQMSVMEVTARNSEKLLGFSPTFTRMTTELFNPMLLRVYQLAAELGKLSDISVPESVMESDDGDSVSVADPGIRYMSAIALALESLQNRAAISTLEAIAPIAQFDPTVLDSINFEAMIPGFSRNNGMPEAWLRTPEEIALIQQRRQELAEQQAEAEIAKTQAEANAQESSN